MSKRDTWMRMMSIPKPASIKRNTSNTEIVSQVDKDNYSSNLPDVYRGLINRIDRYGIYDQMDLDPEIQTSLNIVADFCTQNTKDFDIPFTIKYKDNLGDTEVLTIENRLDAWCKKNDFKVRIRDIVRRTLKYGDQFFVRDPETLEWYYVNPANVEKVVLNESTGKEPVAYYIRDISFNNVDKVISKNANFVNGTGVNGTYAAQTQMAGGLSTDISSGFNTLPSSGSAFQNTNKTTLVVDAKHVVHISLNIGMDTYIYPFGESVLERAYKTYKQKELLEDSVIIYRTQRAPERRVFKIDVGDTPTDRAMAVVEKYKTSMHQKRVPSSKGGSSTLIDSMYNPLSMLEDYYLPITADGRGSSIETLPGGDNLGQIDDMKYFNNQLVRLLSIPSSYVPFGPEDGNIVFNDGQKALVQEIRFNKQCQYWQFIIARVFDREFKKYLIDSGFNVNPNAFEVNFKPPMNYASYREADLMKSMINTYLPLLQHSFMSKQFILEKMGFTKEEMLHNEELLVQELALNNPTKDSKASDVGLDSVGIMQPDDENIQPEDLAGFDDTSQSDDLGGTYQGDTTM